MTTLYHIKLSNGEELITELRPATSSDEYILKNPMIIQDVQDPTTGITAIVLLDYAPFNEMKNAVFLNKSQVISKSLVDTAMQDYYRSSLDYSLLYGHRESMTKIKRAADNLALYTKSRVLESAGYKLEDSNIEEYFTEEELTEDDPFEDFFSENVSANTTIH